MKKPYQKPELFAESFELMEHISDNCSTDATTGANYRSKSDCSYTDANVTLFLTTTVDGKCGGTNYAFDDDLFPSWDDYANSFKDRADCYNAFHNGMAFAS